MPDIQRFSTPLRPGCPTIRTARKARMKPLLVIPPAPNRWPPIDALLADAPPALRATLETRICHGLPDAHDALVAVLDGGRALAAAHVARRGAVGYVPLLFTRPEFRRQGLAIRVLSTLCSWFDMTGGRRLFLTAPAALADGLLANFDFRPIHAHARSGEAWATFCRGRIVEPDESEPKISTATPADWPRLVEALQRVPGADARVPVEESAIAAGDEMLELLARQDRGLCAVLLAQRGEGCAGLGSVALDAPGKRTYAMLIPHHDAPVALRDAIVELARTRGYDTVEFPLEALAGAAPA